MQIPKLLVLVVFYAMFAVGLVMLWNDKRKSLPAHSVADEPRLPAYK